MPSEATGARTNGGTRRLVRYFRRLLSPPLAGDGLVFFGVLEGVLGWGLSWLLSTNPGLVPTGLGVLEAIVLLWVVLTAGIVLAGARLTVPTVPRNRVWLAWAGLNAVATAINLAALADLLPAAVVRFAYWHPWLVVIGVGYLVTALTDPSDPQVRRRERLVYGLFGVGTLGVLAASVGPLTGVVATNVFLIGAVVQIVPMGYDVFVDAAVVLRRR